MVTEVRLDNPLRHAGTSARVRRRITVAAAVAVLVAVGLVTFFTVRHLDAEYGPIGSGNTEGPFTSHNITSGRDEFGFTLSLSTVPGATAQMFELIDNEGSHSVKITSIPTDAVTTNIQWSAYQVTRTHNNRGDPEPWHRFPATVPAHGQIRLLVTIHQPASCRIVNAGTQGGTYYTGYHVVHWQSLLHDHTSTVEYLSNYSVKVC